MRIDWRTFKKFLDDTGLYNFLNYMEFPDNFYIWLTYQGQMFELTLDKATVECEDFINNYKSKAILKSDIADDGQAIRKITHVLSGRYLNDTFVRFSTGTTTTNDQTGFFTAKIYDDQGHETTGENAVKTVVDFMPNFTYEIYAGGIQTIDVLDTDFYATSIVAPDIPPQHGGSIYLIRNKYLIQPRENVFVAGVGTAEIKYNAQVPVANKLRIFVNHDKGEIHRFQLELQYYA